MSAQSNWVWIHVYFGSLCKAQIIDTSKSFSENEQMIYSDFGITEEDRKNLCLKLQSGGLIEKNEVMFPEDRVVILLKQT